MAGGAVVAGGCMGNALEQGHSGILWKVVFTKTEKNRKLGFGWSRIFVEHTHQYSATKKRMKTN